MDSLLEGGIMFKIVVGRGINGAKGDYLTEVQVGAEWMEMY